MASRHLGTQHDLDAPAVEVRDLSIAYQGDVALSGVSFAIEAGQRLAVIGPNGAGKTSLLRALAGLYETSSGQIRVRGHGPSCHVCIAYVPQRSELDWQFPLRVTDFVLQGRIRRIGPLRRARSTDRDVVRHALEVVGLGQLARRHISELSGGQQQRMFLARAVAQEAELILLDEPLAALDVPSIHEVLSLIENLQKQKATFVVSLHDLSIAAEHFERILLLNRQMIGFGPPEEVLVESNLRQAYGSCLQVIEGENGAFVVQDSACSGGDGQHG